MSWSLLMLGIGPIGEEGGGGTPAPEGPYSYFGKTYFSLTYFGPRYFG